MAQAKAEEAKSGGTPAPPGDAPGKEDSNGGAADEEEVDVDAKLDIPKPDTPVAQDPRDAAKSEMEKEKAEGSPEEMQAAAKAMENETPEEEEEMEKKTAAVKAAAAKSE